MQNDIEEKALNQPADDNSSSTSPVPEETSEEVTEAPQKVESTEETKVETEETKTEGESKKGFSNRVRELANENKSLRQRMAELTGKSEQSYNPAPFEPQIVPGSEVSPEQYQQDVMRRADALVTLRIKQSEAVNRIDQESFESMRDHPELDPDSDKFNKDLSESVNEAVEAFVKQNPYSASVKTFVNKLMKPYKGAIAQEVGKVSESLAKQVSQTALRPTSVHKQEKSAKEKSIAELEQELEYVQV